MNNTLQMRARAVQRKTRFALPLLVCSVAFAPACAPSAEPKSPSQLSVKDARTEALHSTDPAVLAAWMLNELLAPDGDPAEASKARKRLDEVEAQGLLPSFARGLDDAAHGRLSTASDHYLKAVRFAWQSDEPDAPLLAWFAAEQAVALKANTSHLFDRWKDWLAAAIKEPKHLGWRARSELVEWVLRENYAAANNDVDALAVKELGCLQHVRLAGPFGNGAVADQVLPFAPDSDQQWPLNWDADPIAGQQPKQLEVEQEGCLAQAAENQDRGVFYAQTDVVLDVPRRLILSATNAVELRVNGVLVLDRRITEWGSWTKAGVELELPAGVHRVQAKLLKAATGMRLMNVDGTPAAVRTLEVAALSPSVAVPAVSGEVNELRRFVNARGVRLPESALSRYVAAALSNWDNEPEAATLLLEPLVKEPAHASGVSLALAADLVVRDPIFGSEQTEDLVRELHVQALRRDPQLWQSELSRVGSLAKLKGLVAAVDELKMLAQRFPEVPAFLDNLSRVYGELGWKPEFRKTVLLRAERFPEDTDGLFAAAQVYEESGDSEAADALFERVRQVEPDTEAFVGRAIERHDYAAAIKELRRLQSRRPQRKELTDRIEELQRTAGGKFDVFELLRAAIKKEPTSGRARLALADAKYAQGETKSLERALVDAVRDGAATGPLKAALDLVEGMTELERFRLDTHQIISAYEASGLQMPGTAARVLDYMAVWVRSDGSSRMLEHEIVRIQSSEAISQFAEQNVGEGIVLKARVLKQDGRILEPELVSGKPTITFPHVEIGDYIETERLFGSFTRAGGTAYDGPQWFFREQNVAYARSEFIFIAPKDREVEFTRRGGAPEPQIEDEGYFRIYRFRVDESQAAPNEPFSVPANEYLPNVHAGWGMNLQRRLQILNKRAFDTTPVDPRLRRIALRIVEPVAKQSELERAKALYHWVMDNVQDGEEEDGRRVVVGKRGNRWRGFAELCRAAGIETRWVLAKNALYPEPQGQAEAAVQFSENLLRVGSGPYAWVQLNERFGAFGYVPAQVRGMPAYVLTEAGPQAVTVPAQTGDDGLTFRGKFVLAKDGSAQVDFSQVFAGRYGAGLRQGLSEVGEGRTKDVVESQLLARNLKGAILQSYEVKALDNIDVPLAVNMKAEVARFARVQGNSLILAPPFALRLSQFATLATRQTPLLMRADQDWLVDVRVALPPGSRVAPLTPQEVTFDGYRVLVRDRVEGGELVLDRLVHIPAGRISPQDYARFVRFTRDADVALNRELRLTLP